MKNNNPHATDTPSDMSKSAAHSAQVASQLGHVDTGVDALITEGREAAAKQEASKAGTQRFPSVGTNTSSTVSTTSMKNNNSTAPLTQPSSSNIAMDTADEAAQYEKLREVSARFEALNNSSKPVTPRPHHQMKEVTENRTQDSIQDVGKSTSVSLRSPPRPNIQAERIDAAKPNEPAMNVSTSHGVKPNSTALANHQTEEDTVMKDDDQDQNLTTAQDQHSYYDDLEDWLEYTGYHDIEYRKRAINRWKKQKELEAKQKELEAQLAELVREAQLEGAYAFRAGPSMSEDVKPTRTVSMPPPPLPFTKFEDTLAASKSTTVAAVKASNDKNLHSRKRPLSPETYSAATPSSLKNTRMNDMLRDSRGTNSVNRGGSDYPHYYNHNTIQTPTSPYEPLERRISGHDDYDNRSRYDSYAPPQRGKPNNVPHYRDSRRGRKR